MHIHRISGSGSLFADLKRILQEKGFGSNEEVIGEIEAYFEVKNKSFYKIGIEIINNVIIIIE